MVRLTALGRNHRHLGLFLGLCLLGVMMTPQVRGTCTLPTSLQNNWYRADDGRVITLTSSTVDNLAISAGSEQLTSFDCKTASGDYYLFGTQKTVSNALGDQVYGYFCWQLVRLSDLTYFLYELTAVAGGGAFANERVLESTSTPGVSSVCTLQSQIPTLLYVVSSTMANDILVASIPSVQCDPEVFATYSYVKDGSGCSGSESQLDFCLDREVARINYTLCSTEILFSKGGLLSCAGSFTIGSDTYQVLINRDTSVADNKYDRFVCMKVTKSGETETATVYPNDCAASSGTHALALTRTVSCPILNDEDPGPDVMIIVIATVVPVVVIASVIVAVVVYKKVYVVHKSRVVTPIKPTRNGSTVYTSKEDDVVKSDDLTSSQPVDADQYSTTAADDSARGMTRLPPLDVGTPISQPLRY